MRYFLTILVSIVACASSATAGDWYVSAYGGVNIDSVIDAPIVESQTGVVVGGTVGKKLAVPGLRIEADLSFRRNEVEIFGGAITADHTTTGLLMNAVYDFDVGSDPLKPYVLAGVGYARTEAVFENVSLLKLEASDVAFQAGAGVQTVVWPGARLGVGYRFFKGPTVEILGTELSDGTNHSVIGSLSFDL